MKTYKSPTDPKRFQLKTSLLPIVVAETVLQQEGHELTEEQKSWFCQHVDLRARWLHANKRQWKRIFEGWGNYGLDYLYMWSRHWAQAFVQNPTEYMSRHTEEMFVQKAAV